MTQFQLPPSDNPTTGLFTAIWVVMTVANFALAVFWIFVGWRAMKAHERLPEVLAAGLSANAANIEPE